MGFRGSLRHARRLATDAGHAPGAKMKQVDVDEVALFTVMSWARWQLMERAALPPMKQHYLWFPVDDVRTYEVCDGAQPEDDDRPGHLLGLNLELVYTLGPSLLDYVRPRGGLDDYIDGMLRLWQGKGVSVAGNEVKVLRAQTLARFCKKRTRFTRVV